MERARNWTASIPTSETAGEYVYLPVSYSEQLGVMYPLPDEEENPPSPADIRQLLEGAQAKLTGLGLSCQADDYKAMYVIPASDIAAQDVQLMEGCIHLAPKRSPTGFSLRSGGRSLQLKPLRNRITALRLTTARLQADFKDVKELMQAMAKKVHKLHLQVLILCACNNLVSKLGIEKEADQRWFEFLQMLKEDEWRQVELGSDARDILIETSMWVAGTTTNEDMAQAIWSLKKIGRCDVNRGLHDVTKNDVSAGKGRRGWDKAFRLESAEEVHGWDELFKLASGSDKSFTAFLDDHERSSSSSSAALASSDPNR